MSNIDDRNELEVALTVMESEALNFAYRFINDGNVRISYINQTKMLAQEYRKKVASGAMQPGEACIASVRVAESDYGSSTLAHK